MLHQYAPFLPTLVQLDEEKAAASDKQSRVIDELRGAQARQRELERQLKALQAQQKVAAGQKQVGRGLRRVQQQPSLQHAVVQSRQAGAQQAERLAGCAAGPCCGEGGCAAQEGQR